MRSVLGTGEVEVNARIPPALSPPSDCHMSACTLTTSNQRDCCLGIRNISGEVRQLTWASRYPVSTLIGRLTLLPVLVQ